MTLTAKNYFFRYNPDQAWILNSIDLEIRDGETVCIVGASGCGKSTLLRLISGLLPSGKSNETSGALSIDRLSPTDYRTKERIAFIFQEPAILPHLTVERNVSLPLDFIPDGELLKAAVPELLQRVGIESLAKAYPKAISGGTKARVALAQTFALRPSLLLLDEPFGSLDVGWRHELYSQLEELRNETQATIILVTHDLDEVLSLADKIIVLSATGTIQNVYGRDEMTGPIATMEELMNDILQTHPAKK